ncbi:unnamed protein product [Rotaria socialis]|uniref:RING-type domain-containing protein n=1 Tax=Rotaria socialis TaxID=392032 RepID=A0A818L572_9BILA|nr:unnamed protein product [Rotaria socialis]CAF3407560.1 unnamed protein product [Rotaria socialis]CAF3497253.1 unnamed protein product [Rotaria socialis]CAF3516123.1 unnamed protein product [Rotaria socialis]CAF3566791.1 unnamed protein product [Rotaria socialis]
MGNLKNDALHTRCSYLANAIKRNKESRRQLASIPDATVPVSLERNSLQEIDIIPTARLRTYASWPHSTPNRKVMSSSGWFYTNFNDRVICIYCNTVCHKWINTDDPFEVHARLAPKCPFVVSATPTTKEAPALVTQNVEGDFQPRHPLMRTMLERQETFNNNTWTYTSPTVHDLAEAGFFYAGYGNLVICFYCGGSLKHWGANDNPKVEHCRWFPNCLYAKHLSGDDLYERIQIRKNQLEIQNNRIDDEILKRLIQARLDLPLTRRLSAKYGISIVRRCIEDQWKMNNDDFSSDSDLMIACFILRQQIDACQGDKNKLIVPSQSQIPVSSSNMAQTKLAECVVCITEGRQLACLPCGHVCACVVCGYSLQTCPVCRHTIQSVVRIYP